MDNSLHTLYRRAQECSLFGATAPEQSLAPAVKAFDLLVDFLRTPEIFPHEEINGLVMLLWHLIGYRGIPVAPDQWDFQLPSLHFLVMRIEQLQTALFILPLRFLGLVSQDPTMQLGAIISMASQGRDFFTQHLDSWSPKRPLAYEAEMLRLLATMHQREGIAWHPNAYQESVLHQYPQGLESLPSEARYQASPFEALSWPSSFIPFVQLSPEVAFQLVPLAFQAGRAGQAHNEEMSK